LTDLGREQAIKAGEWIRENIGGRFDRYYCSEFARYDDIDDSYLVRHIYQSIGKLSNEY